MDHTSSPPRSKSPLAILVAVIVGIVAFALVSRMIGSGFSRPGSAQIGAWETRRFPGMTLEAPFAFERWWELEDKLRSQLQAAIDDCQLFRAGTDSREPAASVSYLHCKAQITPSLDGAANGAIQEVSRRIGDASPQTTTRSLTVDGCDARRVSYPKAHMESLFIRSGQTVWQVQVMTGVSLSSADVERLLASVHPQ